MVVEPHGQRILHSKSVLQLIGNTPLLSFRRLAEPVAPVEVYAKAEWYNPGGSIKDRAALSMILDGERRGLLTKGKTIVDATSGNTGIAYAMIGAERGYKVKLALPKNASPERKQCLLAYGAELILTDPTGGTDGRSAMSRRWSQPIRSLISTRINTIMTPTGRRITKPPPWKSGDRRMGASPISSLAWEPAAPSWV